MVKDLQAPALIGKYRHSDLPYLIDIDVKGCDWPWTRTEWRRNIAWNVLFVARSCGEVVGFLVVDCSYRPIAHVVKLVVHPRCRRLKIGSMLMDHFLREAAACDFTKMTTTIPEYHLDPRSEIDVSVFITQWFEPDGWARDEFNIEGEIMDGVQFSMHL